MYFPSQRFICTGFRHIHVLQLNGALRKRKPPVRYRISYTFLAVSPKYPDTAGYSLKADPMVQPRGPRGMCTHTKKARSPNPPIPHAIKHVFDTTIGAPIHTALLSSSMSLAPLPAGT